MITCVAIIGAGQLGSRHLQGIAKVGAVTKIFIVDPSLDSINVARLRYNEVVKANDKEVFYLENIEELPSKLDLCIIATNSHIRKSIAERLLERSKVKYIIFEKFLFPEVEDYFIVQNLLDISGTQAWVNCPRRMYPFYRALKNSNSCKEPVSMTVTGSNILIGTHAIHFLDLFAFLVGCSDVHSIDSTGLHKHLYDSKRDGYKEFKGNMIFRIGESTLVFQSFEEGNMPLQVAIAVASGRYNVLENNGIVYYQHDTGGWKLETEPFVKNPQSSLTNLVVEQLNEHGVSDLPTYKESATLHLKLLESLLAFLDLQLHIETKVCPIT